MLSYGVNHPIVSHSQPEKVLGPSKLFNPVLTWIQCKRINPVGNSDLIRA